MLGDDPSVPAALRAVIRSSDNPSFSWLDDPAPKGLRMARVLSARAIALSRKIDSMLETAWKRAVRVEPSRDGRNVRITLCRDLHVYWGLQGTGQKADRPLSLQELTNLLQRDQNLGDSLDRLLAELRSSILAKCAPSAKERERRTIPPTDTDDNTSVDEAGPQVSEGEVDEHIFNLASEEEDAHELPNRLVAFMKFMHDSALGPGSSSSSGVKAQLEIFNRRLAGFVISTMLRVSESSLPRALSVKSLPADLEQVDKVSSQARAAFESLQTAGIASDVSEDEDGDEYESGSLASLSRFACLAKELYFKKAIQRALEDVREKLVEDKWDTHIVELKHDVPVPALLNEPEPYPPFVDAPEDTPSPTATQNEARIVEPEPVTLLQPPIHSQGHTPGSSAAGTPREGSPGPGGIGRKPRGKAALGAARIVKPKDQLGSGPWDLDGSGLDDPVPPRTSIAGSGAQNTTIEDDDEDAWDLDEPVVSTHQEGHAHFSNRDGVVAGTNSGESPALTGPHKDVPHHSATTSAMDLDDVDDDAWGLSAEEIATKRASMLGAPVNFSLENFASSSASIPGSDAQKGSNLAPAQQETIDEEDDDDAWGLDEMQLNAKRASTISARAQASAMPQQVAPVSAPAPEESVREKQAETSASSLSSATNLDDDFDEDAWGLSAAELAAKRASMLLPPKIDFSDPSDSSSGDTPTGPSEVVAEERMRTTGTDEVVAEATKLGDVVPEISPTPQPSDTTDEPLPQEHLAPAAFSEESSRRDTKAESVKSEHFEGPPSAEVAPSLSEVNTIDEEDEGLSAAAHAGSARQESLELPQRAIVEPASSLETDAVPESSFSEASNHGGAELETPEEPTSPEDETPESLKPETPRQESGSVSLDANGSLPVEPEVNNHDDSNVTDGASPEVQNVATLLANSGLTSQTSERSLADVKQQQQVSEKPVQKPQPADDDAWGWDDDVEATDADRLKSDAEATTPQTLTERCAVSSRTVFIIKHIQSLLEMADHAETLLGGSSWEIHPSELVMQAVLQELDMHSAIMPAAHYMEFTSVPALSVQFANDCTYLAQQLALMSESFSSHDRKDLAAQLESRAQVTNLLGKQCFEAQIVSVCAAS